MGFGNYALAETERTIKLDPKVALLRRKKYQATIEETIMFEPPMDRCPVCGDYVVLVQAQAECAKRKACGLGTACPLRGAFVQTDFYRTEIGSSRIQQD